MERDDLRMMNRRAATIVAMAAVVILAGTAGYRIISGGRSSVLDCLYMTVITVTTIGYGEIVDLSHSPAGRLFTMGLAFCGIGILTYTLTSVTAFAVDGDLRERWRRRKMQKDIDELRDHYIVCGWGGIASEIVTELAATGRRFVLIVEDAQALKRQMGDQTPPCVLEGDVADEDLLRRAGIARAAGVFATAADPVNVVISLTARQMSSAVRIVASVSEARNSAKMMRAGANSVVSTVAIGALRMASEMVRPAVVSFLDTMLRSRAPVLRVEEVRIADRHEGAALRSLELDRCAEALLMAVKTSGQWSFNPSPDYKIARGDVLIFMTSPAVEAELKRRLS